MDQRRRRRGDRELAIGWLRNKNGMGDGDGSTVRRRLGLSLDLISNVCMYVLPPRQAFICTYVPRIQDLCAYYVQTTESNCMQIGLMLAGIESPGRQWVCLCMWVCLLLLSESITSFPCTCNASRRPEAPYHPKDRST